MPKGKEHVSISADVEGAEIFIDAKMVGETPASFSFVSGHHKIEVNGSET